MGKSLHTILVDAAEAAAGQKQLPPDEISEVCDTLEQLRTIFAYHDIGELRDLRRRLETIAQ